MTGRFIPIVLMLAAAGALRAQPPSPPDAPPPAPAQPEAPENGLKEVFPGVFLDETEKLIELPGRIPIMPDAGDGTVVFLEQLVCTPNTKEHEVLVVVPARPSHVHAALLLLGLEPGKPAEWKVEGDKLVPVPPEGPELEIEFVYTDAAGVEQTAKPSDWVVNFKDRDEHLPERRPVFAGSAMRKLPNGGERYYADSEGTLIGLATFCTEVIAWPDVFSHEASRQEPEWIAKMDMPPLDTKVRVRVRVHRADAEPEAVPPPEDQPTQDKPGAPPPAP